MKLQARINILFILFIFVYQVKGNYTDPMWSVAFYFVLSIYLGITQLTYFKTAILPIYRWVFAITGIFFILFFITEGLCFIYPHRFKDIVVDINMGISGFIFSILFLLLSIKSFTQ